MRNRPISTEKSFIYWTKYFWFLRDNEEPQLQCQIPILSKVTFQVETHISNSLTADDISWDILKFSIILVFGRTYSFCESMDMDPVKTMLTNYLFGLCHNHYVVEKDLWCISLEKWELSSALENPIIA